jgi:hypothetical protein
MRARPRIAATVPGRRSRAQRRAPIDPNPRPLPIRNFQPIAPYRNVRYMTSRIAGPDHRKEIAR